MKAPDHLQHHFADIYSERGEKVEEKFLRDLCNVQDIIAKLWYHYSQKPMEPLTAKEKTQYSKAQNCYICSKPFKYEGSLDEWVRQRKEMKEMKNTSSSSRKRKIISEDTPKFVNHFTCDIDELGPKIRDHDHFSGSRFII